MVMIFENLKKKLMHLQMLCGGLPTNKFWKGLANLASGLFCMVYIIMSSVILLLPLFLIDKLLIQWPKAKGQTMIYKTPHRKSKIVQHEPDLKPGVKRSRYTSETRRITD